MLQPNAQCSERISDQNIYISLRWSYGNVAKDAIGLAHDAMYLYGLILDCLAQAE